jgi:two-component system response regulator FixJ
VSLAPTLFVVDDDPATRDSLHFLADSVHLPVVSFASAEEFLASYDRSHPGCLLLDIRMPGMSGLELQEQLETHGIELPVIIVTAHGDVTSVVRALRKGAVDFLEKPVHEQGLLEKVRQALARDTERRAQREQARETEQRLASLTPREREVLALVADGESSKGVAARLGLSPNTVQNQRASIMRKMQASSVGQLVKMYTEAAARRR